MSVQAPEVDVSIAIELLRRALLIRRFEERVSRAQAAGELHGAVHLCIGQEAVAAGVCVALRDDDYITSTHRGHGHIIAKGGDLARCMAELFGRDTGYCRGKGGSMHIADMAIGIVGANGIVGAGIPIATGAALAAQLRRTDAVSVAFFGEGAANAGSLAESLNLAAIWSLPTIFVCENNGWGELTRMERVTARGAFAQHAEAYGMVGERVDGNDALAVLLAARQAVERARSGAGPTFIEALTYRIREHSEGLDAIVGKTRTEDELAAWRARDPIDRLRHTVVDDFGVDASVVEDLDARIVADVEAAVAFARASDPPARSLAFDHMWSPTDDGEAFP